ncbi:MAG: hypothetical protein ACK5W9_12885, partial [Bdellovibrionales bacterium]
DGTFTTPPLKTLLAQLKIQIAKLNSELKELGADFEIKPQLFLDMENSDYGLSQKVILSPLQEFSAPGFKLSAKSNILKTLPFYKFISTGGFPIGAIESASGLSRALVEFEKSTQDPNQKADFNSRANISDFLHDLAHLSAFIRNPKFAAAYVRAFRHQHNKIQRMPAPEQAAYIAELSRSGSPEWRRNFYFSESAWVVSPSYHQLLAHYPILSSLIKNGNTFSSEQITALIDPAGKQDLIARADKQSLINGTDKQALLEELKNLKRDWWKLFDPLGGAVNDMISARAFNARARSNFIIEAVLIELELLLNTHQPLDSKKQNSLAIVLGFLKNSPRMTVDSWEYFARSDDWKNSQAIKVLQDIFPKQEIQQQQRWETLSEFLYGSN